MPNERPIAPKRRAARIDLAAYAIHTAEGLVDLASRASVDTSRHMPTNSARALPLVIRRPFRYSRHGNLLPPCPSRMIDARSQLTHEPEILPSQADKSVLPVLMSDSRCRILPCMLSHWRSSPKPSFSTSSSSTHDASTRSSSPPPLVRGSPLERHRRD
jgi:hypothetical protein